MLTVLHKVYVLICIKVQILDCLFTGVSWNAFILGSSQFSGVARGAGAPWGQSRGVAKIGVKFS